MVSDEDEVIPTATAPDVPPEAETSAAGEVETSAAGEAEISESFQLVLGNSTDNPKSVLSVGGKPKAWGRRVNWTQDALPLDLQIRHEKKDKHQTPLVRRLHHLQKQMTKKLKGGSRKDPHFLSQTFFVPVFDGELQNQSVSFYTFLDASSHLYQKVCPSVCPSVTREALYYLPGFVLL